MNSGKNPAIERGRLFVFEGPDGFGKSTLAEVLLRRMEATGVSVRLHSFPGRETGTLGALVYGLHHSPVEHGVRKIDASALQMLHLAAHIDSIRQVLAPSLSQGVSVVLDRFWWSLSAYGKALGADKMILRHAVNIEKYLFQEMQPDCVFLVNKAARFRSKSEQEEAIEASVLGEYNRLARSTRNSSIVFVDNSKEKEQVVAEAWAAYTNQLGRK